ncbi:MAG: hypothetical protein FWC00_06405, partial [Firmicutes bacterium]|nr:hypothetical protein [Bacillota bacterium]
MKKLRNILITLLLLSIVLIIINFWLGSMFEEHEQSSTGQTLYIVGGVGALGSILGLMVIGIMRFVREFRGAIKEESARARVQASKNNDAQSKFVASLSDA